MRVMLFNDGGYGYSQEVEFPVEVEGVPYYESHGRLCGVDVLVSTLHNKGFKFHDIPDTTLFFSFTGGDCERLPDEQPTKCDITNKCCNQFGERDEMQAIINSLQADVIARGARIKTLEDALRNTNEELHGAINEVNHHLEHNICSSDLDDPDYWDLQTVHDGGRDA